LIVFSPSFSWSRSRLNRSGCEVHIF
jgi:hypothetical protein